MSPEVDEELLYEMSACIGYNGKTEGLDDPVREQKLQPSGIAHRKVTARAARIALAQTVFSRHWLLAARDEYDLNLLKGKRASRVK